LNAVDLVDIVVVAADIADAVVVVEGFHRMAVSLDRLD
jgi:hypothetical protein